MFPRTLLAWVAVAALCAACGANADAAAPAVAPAAVADLTQAAQARGWGPVVAGDEFNYIGAPNKTKWNTYNSAGHNGKGLRRPAQITVNGTAAVVSGTSAGTTGGMSANFDRRLHGRWEARMKTSARDPKYHPVLILWPDAGSGSRCPEIDYSEASTDTKSVGFFLHYGCAPSQTYAKRTIDQTVAHNYAVEWSSKAVIGYIDGTEWFRDTNVSHIPTGGMHQTIQLDWFPVSGQATKASTMTVDWVRVYNGSTAPTPTVTPVTPSVTPSVTPVTPTPTSAGDVVVAAVGDQNPSGNSSLTSNSGKVAASIAAQNPDAVLSLGDHQYTYGTCSAFLAGYDKIWGKLNGKLYPTAGPTHDFNATNSNGQQYSAYMSGTCPGQTSAKTAAAVLKGGTLKPTDLYSFDKGTWHIVQLPSGCYRYTVCDRPANLAWLNADLAAAQAAGKHILGFWHEPYWTAATDGHSTTEGDYTKPYLDALAAHGARLVLNGHQHGYQHFFPQTAAGVRDDANGVEEFVVGTGGIGFYPFTSSAANTKVRSSDTYGWLKLVLHADGGYTYQFVGTGGGTTTDAGFRN